MTRKKSIDSKIKEAKKELKIYEKDNVFNLTKDDYELYSIVQHYHALFEVIFNGFISDYLISSISQGLTVDDKRNLKNRTFVILDGISFSRKIDILKKFSLISKKLVSKLFKFNEIRVDISHPVSHLEKIGNYSKKENYLKALQLIMELTILLSNARKINKLSRQIQNI